MNSSKHTEPANHAWSVADLLRGDYKQSGYGKVILPFTVPRRLKCTMYGRMTSRSVNSVPKRSLPPGG